MRVRARKVSLKRSIISSVGFCQGTSGTEILARMSICKFFRVFLSEVLSRRPRGLSVLRSLVQKSLG